MLSQHHVRHHPACHQAVLPHPGGHVWPLSTAAHCSFAGLRTMCLFDIVSKGVLPLYRIHEERAWIAISSFHHVHYRIVDCTEAGNLNLLLFLYIEPRTGPNEAMLRMPLCSSHAYAAPGKHAHLTGVNTPSCRNLPVTLPWTLRMEGVDYGMAAHCYTRHGKCSSERRAPSVVHCQPDAQSSEPENRPSPVTNPPSISGRPVILTLGSIGLAIVAFLASRSLLGRPALEELRLQSLPLDTALDNGRPTLLEFYADWCEVCSELAPATLQVRPTVRRRVALHRCFPCIWNTKASLINEYSF